MERRTLFRPGGVSLEQRADDDEPRIVGVASVFYDGSERTEYELWRGAVERIMPTAFNRAAREDDVRAMVNHNPDRLLGRSSAGTLRLEIKPDGLHYSTEPADTTIYRDTREQIRRGDMTGSSFSFRVVSDRWSFDKERRLEVREIEDVELADVGPVTFPAYESTSAGVRSADSIAEARTSYARHRGLKDRERARQVLERLRLRGVLLGVR